MNQRMRPWLVLLGHTVVDTVFYVWSADADYVRRGLIDPDGYPDGIEVKPA